jgi:hypothetical protein
VFENGLCRTATILFVMEQSYSRPERFIMRNVKIEYELCQLPARPVFGAEKGMQRAFNPVQYSI